jgi:hypothetical protein
VKKKKFNVGYTVRINRTSNIFEKGNYTKHVTHRLRDMKDEEILGSFCEYELQKIKNKRVYQIEKILKSRSSKGNRQLLVRWLGYDSDFDSWTAAEDVHNA